MPQDSATYRRSGHLAWRQVGDEMVVVDLRDRRIHGLNLLGGRLWELLEKQPDVDALVDTLSSGRQTMLDEDVKLEIGANVVVAFLEELVDAGLVERDGRPATALGRLSSQSTRREQGGPALLWTEDLAKAVSQRQCGLTPGDCSPGQGTGHPLRSS